MDDQTKSEELLPYPFDSVNGRFFPKPKLLLTMMLAEYRSSKKTDSELADIFQKSLATIMSTHGLIIDSTPSDIPKFAPDLIFKEHI